MARCSVRTKSSAASSIVAFFPRSLIIATSVLIKTTWVIGGETCLSTKSARMSRVSAMHSAWWAFVISPRTSLSPANGKMGFIHARFVSQAGGGPVAKSRRCDDLRDGYLP